MLTSHCAGKKKVSDYEDFYEKAFLLYFSAVKKSLLFCCSKRAEKRHYENEGAFLTVLTGISPYAYRREDGVYVVPITVLKNQGISIA